MSAARLQTVALIAGGGPFGLTAAIELGWRGIPAIIVTRLNADIHASQKTAAVKTNSQRPGAQLAPESPDHFQTFIATELRKWTALAATAEIKAE